MFDLVGTALVHLLHFVISALDSISGGGPT